MLRTLRLLAVALAVGLFSAETIRSWGVHRPIFAVVDDYLMSGFLVLLVQCAAVRHERRRDTRWRGGESCILRQLRLLRRPL